MNAIQMLIMVLFAFEWLSALRATLLWSFDGVGALHSSGHTNKKGVSTNRRCCIDSMRYRLIRERSSPSSSIAFFDLCAFMARGSSDSDVSIAQLCQLIFAIFCLVFVGAFG